MSSTLVGQVGAGRPGRIHAPIIALYGGSGASPAGPTQHRVEAGVNGLQARRTHPSYTVPFSQRGGRQAIARACKGLQAENAVDACAPCSLKLVVGDAPGSDSESLFNGKSGGQREGRYYAELLSLDCEKPLGRSQDRLGPAPI